MTGFLTISVALALLVPAVSGGSYATLLQQRWYWKSAFFMAFALQAAADHLPHPAGHDLGFGALIASYLLLVAFCGRNLIKTGMAVVMIGVALNAVVIAANHGMPVQVPQAWSESAPFTATVKHHEHSSDTKLFWLSDVIYLQPTDQMISFGDLTLAIGLIDMAFHASRRKRSRRIMHSHPARPEQHIDLTVPTSGHWEMFDDDEIAEFLRGRVSATDDADATQRYELQRIDN